MKTTRILPAWLGALLLICSATAESTNTVATEKTKPCFQCNGTGKMKCPVASCKDGQSDCPAPCIKLSQGVWVKRPDLHRPDPNELMQLITVEGHKVWVSSHHEGVRYVWANGQAEMQTCPVCKGTAKATCSVCKGKSFVTCPICDGKGIIPESWSAFDNPKMKNRPSRFTLKDGRVLIGRTRVIVGSSVTIRTEKGDVQLEKADILAEEKQPSEK